MTATIKRYYIGRYSEAGKFPIWVKMPHRPKILSVNEEEGDAFVFAETNDDEPLLGREFIVLSENQSFPENESFGWCFIGSFKNTNSSNNITHYFVYTRIV